VGTAKVMMVATRLACEGHILSGEPTMDEVLELNYHAPDRRNINVKAMDDFQARKMEKVLVSYAWPIYCKSCNYKLYFAYDECPKCGVNVKIKYKYRDN
jgi:hypothetical protein